jgi:GDP-L-fucose synthase
MGTQRFELKGKRVFVAGHRGMVGSAIVRRLQSENCDIVTADRRALDLRSRDAVKLFLADRRPDAVFLAAAVVGGILANSRHPTPFLMDNLAIAQSVIAGSFEADVAKLLFFGSSCIYPRLAPQPMAESALLTGPLEPTNEWYAIAKIAGIKMCQAYRRQYGADFISVMPTNLYGPGDNFHPEHSHVPAALMQRFDEAKRSGAGSVTVWGTGSPRREFLFVDDLADGGVFAMQAYSDEQILNIGTGRDVTIAEFAETMRDVVGYRGGIEFDRSKPDGPPRKLLDVSRMNELGWTAQTGLGEGLGRTYDWYLSHQDELRKAS